MKNLNRNIYLLLIGIIEAIFIIYTVVMSRRENIETEELVFGCCSMAIMTAICIVVAFINKIGKKKEESPKLDLIEVPRAREGVIFEVLTLLIIAVAWTVAIVTNRFWMMEGSFFFLEPVTMFILTILAITVLWIVYMPRFLSMVRRHTHVKQVALEVLMCRVLAVELALFVLGYALPLGDLSTGFFYQTIIFYIAGAVLLVTIAVFRYLIYKAQSNPEDIEHDAVVDGSNINQVRTRNTVVGIMIEVLVAVLVVLAWVLGAKNGVFTQDYYHNNLNYDRRLSCLVFFTILIIWMLWRAHRPDEIIKKGKWPKVTNLKQARLATWVFRVYAIIIAIFMLLIPFQRFNAIWLTLGMAVVTFITGLIFIILIRRAKDNPVH